MRILKAIKLFQTFALKIYIDLFWAIWSNFSMNIGLRIVVPLKVTFAGNNHAI
jgi:hypothetical protein